jgi:hypothetical protein
LIGGEGGSLRKGPLFSAVLAAIRQNVSRFKILAAPGSFVEFRRVALSCGLCRLDVTQNVTQADSFLGQLPSRNRHDNSNLLVSEATAHRRSCLGLEPVLNGASETYFSCPQVTDAWPR